MVVIACTIPGCEFKTQDVSELIAIALLGNHTVGHHKFVEPVISGTCLRAQIRTTYYQHWHVH